MRALKTLIAIGCGVALLVASPAAAAPQPGQQKAFRYYVACGLSQKATPSHRCQKPRDKGAFFRSNSADVFYTVCVKFPTKKNLCAPKQEAVQGTLYVNRITTNIPGKHRVSWFVKGKRVGSFEFLVPERGKAANRKGK